MYLDNTKIFFGDNKELRDAIAQTLMARGYGPQYVLHNKNSESYYIYENGSVRRMELDNWEYYIKHVNREISPAQLLLGESFWVSCGGNQTNAIQMLLDLGMKSYNGGKTPEETIRKWTPNYYNGLSCHFIKNEFYGSDAAIFHTISYQRLSEVHSLIKNAGLLKVDKEEKSDTNTTMKNPLDNLPAKFQLKNATVEEKRIAINLLRSHCSICRIFEKALGDCTFSYSTNRGVWGRGYSGLNFTQITFTQFLNYYHGFDQYRKLKQLPKINGYDGEYDPDSQMVIYGCAQIDESLIRDANAIMNRESEGNRSIKAITLDSEVEITRRQAKEIVEYLDNQ